jgi:hypothetical protein
MPRASLHPLKAGIAIILLLSFAAHVRAIPPIILHEFAFDSGRSQLGVTGGFAGINELHGIDGTFGLAIGYDQIFDPPTIRLVPFASFADVDAKLTKPGLLEGSDLDGLLNLTGLEGSLVDGPDFRGLLFTGVDGQGQPIKVRATIGWGQLHLEGENAAGCCDMFSYRLDAYAKLPQFGDLNKDGYVGIADLNMVLGDFGKDVTPMMGADADWDGFVGIEDLNAVLGNWNAGLTGSAPSLVPEPVSPSLILTGLACWMLRRRG